MVGDWWQRRPTAGCLDGLGLTPSCFLRCMGPRSQCMTPCQQSSLLSGVIISHETERKLSGQPGRRRKVRSERNTNNDETMAALFISDLRGIIKEFFTS